MAGKAAAVAAKPDDNSNDSSEVTPDPNASASANDSSAASAAASDEKPAKAAKPEKAFSRAEMQAEIAKAVAAEKTKWEAEKDLSELERAKKELDDLKASNQLRDAKDEVVAQLTASGNKSPELAFNAIRGDLKFDDKGKLVNAKDLIEGLKTSFPEQFGTEKPTEGIDAGAGGGSTGTKLTVADIEKMTPAQINANWAEVSKVLAAGK
jgi:hypothetical protein